jgi:ATP-binding cassette subfamily B protein
MFKRFVCVRQADQSDCGPAALATIALHYGIRLSREKLRDISGTDRSGTTVFGLVKAAERLGFSPRPVKGPYDALAKLPMPVIAHTKNEQGLGHYVVVHRVTAKQVVLADPAQGIVRKERAEFEKRWTGSLLILAPGKAQSPDAMPTGGVPPSPMRRFTALLLRYRRILIEAFACALLMTALGISSSYFLQHLVDSVLVRADRPLLHAFAFGMLFVVLFKTLLGALRQYLLAHVARQASLTLIADYTRHILALPLRFYEMRRVGEILSRISDAAKVRDLISGVTLTALVDGTMVLITIVVLFAYDVRLALVATLFVPLLLISVLAHHPAARARSRRAMEQSAELAAHLNEDVSGVETVKALRQEDARAEQAEGKLVNVVQSSFSLQKLSVSASAAATLATGAAGVVVLWYGGMRVMDGALTIGQLMFFNSLLAYVLSPLERLASVNLSIQDALVAVDRLYQVMDLDLEQAPGVPRARLENLRRGIELRNVSFQYGGRTKVLSEIDLDIPVGKTVAIVGESGQGKTTILKMLMRFHDPTEGQLLFDGVDARDLDTSSVRGRIAMVSQEPFIFTGTFRENIAMGCPDASLEDILRACVNAGLAEVIASLPQRLETMLGERGANLSGGQRQRIAIARALLAQPDVLIFDEATSHLDTATERAIQKTLKTALAGKTVVIVAHRLSTVRDADVICVLNGGKIVERGSHTELMNAGGKYAALTRAQVEVAAPSAPSPAISAPPPAISAGTPPPAISAGMVTAVISAGTPPAAISAGTPPPVLTAGPPRLRSVAPVAPVGPVARPTQKVPAPLAPTRAPTLRVVDDEATVIQAAGEGIFAFDDTRVDLHRRTGRGA